MNTIIDKALNAVGEEAEKRRLISDEARMTLPTLSKLGMNEQVIVIAFYLGDPRPVKDAQPRRIRFPFLEARVAIQELKIEFRDIDGDDFGLIIPAGENIGDLGDIKSIDVATYLTLREQYFKFLSILAEKRWLVSNEGATNESKAVAKNLFEVLKKISAKALEPYYAHTFKDLRDWLSLQGYSW
jgi:hypothetical protein